MEEIWKDITGFEGYQVSNQGRVRSCRALRRGKGGVWRELVPRIEQTGKSFRCIITLNKIPGDRKKFIFKVHRLLWEAFNGPIPEGMVIDHIDRNPLNNHISNLRLATRSQNISNSKGKSSRQHSQYKGVTKARQLSGWCAGITVENKYIHLGTFKTEEEAAEAYNQAALKYHKDFACLNVVDKEIH